MKVFIHETYWSCKLISAYSRLQKAMKRHDSVMLARAKNDVVLSLTRLGKYDLEIAEFAFFTRLKFAEEGYNDVVGYLR